MNILSIIIVLLLIFNIKYVFLFIAKSIKFIFIVLGFLFLYWFFKLFGLTAIIVIPLLVIYTIVAVSATIFNWFIS